MTSTRSAKKKTKNSEDIENAPVLNVIDQNDAVNDKTNEQANNSENSNIDGSTGTPSGAKNKDKNSPETTMLDDALPQSGLLTPSGAKPKNKNLSFTEPAHKKTGNKFAAAMSLFQTEDFSKALEKPANTHKKKVIHVNEIWEKSGEEHEMYSPVRREKMSSKRRLVVADEEGSDPEFEDFKGR